MNPIYKIPSQYLKYFLVATAMDLLLRIIETVHVFIRFNPRHLIISELFGLMRDVFAIGFILILFFPLYHPLHKKFPFNGKILTWFFIGLFVFLHITISEYFFYQLKPLDIFVFKHRPEEVAFSLNTAGFNIFFIPFLKYTVVLLTYLLIAVYAEKKILNIRWYKPIINSYLMISGIFIPLYLFVKLPVSSNLSINKSTFIYVSILKDWYHRLLGPDILKLSDNYQKEFPNQKYIRTDYPFLHAFNSEDKLSGYFNLSNQSPNLVIFIVEGLSDEFLHPVKGISFMPFFDSLSRKSLYWNRFFTNGERSFAVTPSLVGSLPFGQIGFALMNQYPYHFSLVNVFKENNFYTSFYYGQGAWFHGMEPFYKFNNIDRIVDKSTFDNSLVKVYIGDEDHFWGYNDIDLFRQYFITTDSAKKEKRLDIFFTGTSHAPFNLKYPNYYHYKLDKEIKALRTIEDKEWIEKYRTFYASLYNVDDAFRYFFKEYSKRPEFSNTVFLITGDHPMTEIPSENNLKKYHVPLIIYSPALKQAETFHGICSHLDVYESIISLYNNCNQFKVPSQSTALGKGLSFSNTYDNSIPVPIMNDNRQINDFLYKGYFISEDKTLYKIEDNLDINEYYDIKNWDKMYKKLQSFRAASLNASIYHKLMPDSCYFNFFNYKMLDENSRNEKFILGPDPLILTKELVSHGHPIYLDIAFKRWEHLDFIPECVVSLYNRSHTLLNEFVHELKAQQDECQFHILLPVNDCTSRNCYFQAVLKNKESHGYMISDLTVKVYEKVYSDKQ